MNIHEQINELISALKENTAALKGAAVQTEAAPKKRAPKVETPAPEPEKPAETPKGEEKKPETPKVEAAAEVSKPGVPEFIASAQKLLDGGQIAVVRGIKEKFGLPRGASSAVGTEHEDAVWAELQAAIAKLK